MNAKKVIIDCDPGIDDSLALMLALASPELEILGITVVCGNVPVEKGAENALKVLEWMGRTEIPVYLGETKPLVREYVDAMDTHGADGLGESGYPPVTHVRPKEDAVSFLIETLSTTKHVSIIALGPLTNIARVLQRCPQCMENLDEFVSMGGSFKSHGNCSPVAEYNYWCDPHGAGLVYEAFAKLPCLRGKPIHMIGLDVTRKIVLTPNILEYILAVDPEVGERIRAITRFYFDFHWKQEGVIGCVINDPLAVAYFIERSLCGGFSCHTAIETEGLCMGQSVADSMDIWKKPHNSYVLTQVSEKGFWKMFLQRAVNAQEGQLEEIFGQILPEMRGEGK